MAVSLWDITSTTLEEPDVQDSIFLVRRGVRSLGYLTALTGLRCLSLACNSLTDLSGIAKLQQLQLLDVSFNQLTTLAGIDQLPNLVTLNAAHNKLASTAPLQSLQQLRQLSLHNNAISAPSALLALSLLQRLTALTLRGNPIVKATPSYAAATTQLLPELRLLDQMDAAALLAASSAALAASSNSNTSGSSRPNSRPHSSSTGGAAGAAYLSWQELAEQQASAGISGKQQAGGAVSSRGSMPYAGKQAPASSSSSPVPGRTPRTKAPAGGSRALQAGGSSSSGSGTDAVSGLSAVLQEQHSMRYPDGSLAATIRVDGSAMVYWPSGRMAASLELQPGISPPGPSSSGAIGSYQLLAMYDGTGGNVAVTGSPGEGCAQWPTGALMLTWKTREGSGSSYDVKGKLQKRWAKSDVSSMEPIELALGNSLALKLTPSSGEALLSVTTKALKLHLSTTRGTLQPDGSTMAKSISTDAAVAGGSSSGAGSGAKPARSRVQPGGAGSGASAAAHSSSSSSHLATQPTPSTTAAAAAAGGPLLTAAEAAAAAPGPEELQALISRAKALMASSGGAAAADGDPEAPGVGAGGEGGHEHDEGEEDDDDEYEEDVE